MVVQLGKFTKKYRDLLKTKYKNLKRQFKEKYPDFAQDDTVFGSLKNETDYHIYFDDPHPNKYRDEKGKKYIPYNKSQCLS